MYIYCTLPSVVSAECKLLATLPRSVSVCKVRENMRPPTSRKTDVNGVELVTTWCAYGTLIERHCRAVCTRIAVESRAVTLDEISIKADDLNTVPGTNRL